MKNNIDELIQHWREMGPIVWAEGVFGWIDLDGEPIRLEPWQRAVLSFWWIHRFIISTLVISNIKKTGKTFANAVLLAWRWLALPGEHFAVGNDMDQSAGRQFLQIVDMVKRNRYLRQNVKITSQQLLFKPTGSTITALAVDAAGNAGANHLTASHTETWGIIYEGGVRAFEELTLPPGRFYGLPALRICDSYAGFLGESNTWHDLVDRGLEGEHISSEWPIYKSNGLLLFHMDGEDAQERCFRGSNEEADMYYADQRLTLRDGTYLRLHKNKRATGQEQYIPLEDWDAGVNPEHTPVLPTNDFRLFVGVDGAIKNDSAAVVAVYRDRSKKKIVLAKHRIWHPTSQQPLDLDQTIGEFLRDLHRNYSLSSIYYDPYQLHDLATRLRSEGIKMEEYPQSQSNLIKMGQNLFELIMQKNLILYPDTEMRLQASHTIALETQRGWRIAKEKTSHKIDAIVALAMAALAAVEKGNRSTWEDVKDLGHVDGYRNPWAYPGDDDLAYIWRK